MPLLLLFFIVPIVEMYLLIAVAGYINALPTVGLVMLTAVIGVALLKRQGLATLTRGVGRMNSGQVPGQEITEGILLGIAGALMITPGFVTDGIGFLLLFPPSRIAVASYILRNASIKTNFTQSHDSYKHASGSDSQTGHAKNSTASDSERSDSVREGEYLPKRDD
jgi:UPF0716 protein FxsA